MAHPSEQDPRMVALVGNLSSSSRRRRQEVVHEIVEIAQHEPERLHYHIPALIDALNRPEAQTRWEVLTALTHLVHHFSDKVCRAFEGAETALFDDESATVRLAAFLFLCELGTISPKRSKQCWPLLDEAIQCYHGDAEYRDMLQGVHHFVQGNIAKDVKKEVVERVSFDAEKGTSYIKRLSQEIIDVATK